MSTVTTWVELEINKATMDISLSTSLIVTFQRIIRGNDCNNQVKICDGVTRL